MKRILLRSVIRLLLNVAEKLDKEAVNRAVLIRAESLKRGPGAYRIHIDDGDPGP